MVHCMQSLKPMQESKSGAGELSLGRQLGSAVAVGL